MAVQRISQYLGAINSERLGPALDGICLFVRHTKAEHRHTADRTAYDKSSRASASIALISQPFAIATATMRKRASGSGHGRAALVEAAAPQTFV
jgi:hypothetical protein